MGYETYTTWGAENPGSVCWLCDGKGMGWLLLRLRDAPAVLHSRAVEDQTKEADVVVGYCRAAGLHMQSHIEKLCFCDEHIPGEQGSYPQNDKDTIHKAKPAYVENKGATSLSV